ncbi:hypothetical protein [Caudoviricetes sp.]|nr:hypothetical protein [Caudoviricetes sp.]
MVLIRRCPYKIQLTKYWDNFSYYLLKFHARPIFILSAQLRVEPLLLFI